MSTNVYGRATGTGTNDDDVVILLSDASPFNAFNLHSTAGAMEVYVSLNGTNYCTAPLSLTDLGATDSLPVLETAAGRLYGFRIAGAKAVKVVQKGATAVTVATLSYSSW